MLLLVVVNGACWLLSLSFGSEEEGCKGTTTEEVNIEPLIRSKASRVPRIPRGLLLLAIFVTIVELLTVVVVTVVVAAVVTVAVVAGGVAAAAVVVAVSVTVLLTILIVAVLPVVCELQVVVVSPAAATTKRSGVSFVMMLLLMATGFDEMVFRGFSASIVIVSLFLFFSRFFFVLKSYLKVISKLYYYWYSHFNSLNFISFLFL